MLFTVFKYRCLFQRYSSFQNMQIGQMMMSYTQNPILIKLIEVRYFSQIVSEMLDSLQHGSVNCTTQYELNSFVTMATYWVPGLLHNKGYSSHIWRSHLIFAYGA